jgi:hypothetical protein
MRNQHEYENTDYRRAGFLGVNAPASCADAGHDVVTTDRHGDVDLTGDLSDEQSAVLPEVDAVVHSGPFSTFPPTCLGLPATLTERNNVQATRHMVERYGGRTLHFCRHQHDVQQCGMVRRTGQPHAGARCLLT